MKIRNPKKYDLPALMDWQESLEKLIRQLQSLNVEVQSEIHQRLRPFGFRGFVRLGTEEK